jgi:hypothetical protein
MIQTFDKISEESRSIPGEFLQSKTFYAHTKRISDKMFLFIEELSIIFFIRLLTDGRSKRF